MKTNSIIAALLIICVFIVSCQEDVETPLLQDQDGFVFLEDGKMVKANTNFTEEDLISCLENSSWTVDYNETLIYDQNKIEKFEKEVPGVNSGGLIPIRYNFINDSIFTEREYPLLYCPYVINKNNITLYVISPVTKLDTISSYTYKVISLDPRRIILDVNYHPNMSSSFRPLPKNFNAETSKVRYIWRKYGKDKI